MNADYENLQRLPLAEKLELIDLLWRDIESSAVPLPVGDHVRVQAESRDAELEADPCLGIDRDEVWRRVNDRRG